MDGLAGAGDRAVDGVVAVEAVFREGAGDFGFDDVAFPDSEAGGEDGEEDREPGGLVIDGIEDDAGRHLDADPEEETLDARGLVDGEPKRGRCTRGEGPGNRYPRRRRWWSGGSERPVPVIERRRSNW